MKALLLKALTGEKISVPGGFVGLFYNADQKLVTKDCEGNVSPASDVLFTTGTPVNAVAATCIFGDSAADGVSITAPETGAAFNGIDIGAVASSNALTTATYNPNSSPQLLVELGTDSGQDAPAVVAAAINAGTDFLASGQGSTAITDVTPFSEFAGGTSNATVAAVPTFYYDSTNEILWFAASNTASQANWVPFYLRAKWDDVAAGRNLTSADHGKMLNITGDNPNVTVPASLRTGFSVMIRASHANGATIVASGTTVNTARSDLTIAQHEIVNLIWTAANTYVLA